MVADDEMELKEKEVRAECDGEFICCAVSIQLTDKNTLFMSREQSLSLMPTYQTHKPRYSCFLGLASAIFLMIGLLLSCFPVSLFSLF